MSDLRDFNASSDSDIGRTRIEPPLSQSPMFETSFDRPEPLGEFHTIETEESSNTGRIVGGLVVALMLGSAAVYGFEVSNHPAQPVATQTAVNTPAPAPVTAPAPAQSADATPAATPAPSEAASSSVTPPAAMAPAPAATSAPVKKAPVRSARVDNKPDNSASVGNQSAANAQPAPVDSSSVQAQQQASSAGTPEQGAVQPVYPTAPSSSLATNNVQPVVPSDVPQPQIQSTPVPAPQPDQAAQPAPDQSQAAQPSPDQSGQPVQ